eukprot:1948082-Prymnesium_polylepis.1
MARASAPRAAAGGVARSHTTPHEAEPPPLGRAARHLVCEFDAEARLCTLCPHNVRQRCRGAEPLSGARGLLRPAPGVLPRTALGLDGQRRARRRLWPRHRARGAHVHRSLLLRLGELRLPVLALELLGAEVVPDAGGTRYRYAERAVPCRLELRTLQLVHLCRRSMPIFPREGVGGSKCRSWRRAPLALELREHERRDVVTPELALAADREVHRKRDACRRSCCTLAVQRAAPASAARHASGCSQSCARAVAAALHA